MILLAVIWNIIGAIRARYTYLVEYPIIQIINFLINIRITEGRIMTLGSCYNVNEMSKCFFFEHTPYIHKRFL